MPSKNRPSVRLPRLIIRRNNALYNLARLMMSPLAKIIDKLTKVKNVGFYNAVARDVDYDPSSFMDRLKKMSEYGASFTVDIDFLKLGLLEYVVFVPDKILNFEELPETRSWIRSITATYSPKGTLLTFSVPYDFRNELSSEITGSIEKITGQKTYSFFILPRRKQPSLTKYPFEKHPLLIGYKYSQLEEIFNESVPDDYIEKFLYGVENLNKVVRNTQDMVDLLIVGELEIDAFSGLWNAIKAYNIRYRKARKHLKEHVIKHGIIRGIYMKAGLFVRALGHPLVLLLVVRGKDMLFKWHYFLDRLENTMYLGYEPFRRRKLGIYAILYESLDGLESLKHFLVVSLKEGYLEDFLAIKYLPHALAKFTIPFKNYYQDAKRWDLDIGKTHALFERRFLKRRTAI
ncbi:MAG: hypothetical protein ABWW65_03095 [Thermoprotei archaeon]